jgi:hypothetical protein
VSLVTASPVEGVPSLADPVVSNDDADADADEREDDDRDEPDRAALE